MKLVILILIFLMLAGPASGQQTDWLDYRGSIELQAFKNNSSRSWYSGGWSKLRYDKDSFPVQLGKAALHLDFRFTDTLWARTLSTAYTDPDFDPNIVEAYLNYRPVPQGPLRIRAKAGAFYMPLSTENIGIGWSSPYSTTWSVINSWIGEELRVIGSEITLDWPGRVRQSAHDFSLTGGIYGYNDGLGTILAERGWAAHDRQTGLGDKLRLPWESSPAELLYNHPFWEIDDRAGYYLGGSWAYMDRVKIAALHYDNRADPTASLKEEDAWLTQFEHVSAEIDLGKEIKLIGQYMVGDTYILTPGRYSSDTNFSAWFVLLTRLIDKHRVSARYEEFDADYLEIIRLYTFRRGDETGNSWMLAYRYYMNEHIQMGVEWLRIRTERNNRARKTGLSSETEKQLLFNISYRF